MRKKGGGPEFECLFDFQSAQTNYHKICICCFSGKHTALRRKSKDWLHTQNPDNVSEWNGMSLSPPSPSEMHTCTCLIIKLQGINNQVTDSDTDERERLTSSSGIFQNICLLHLKALIEQNFLENKLIND